MSDDDRILILLKEKHKPDEKIEYDVKPIFPFVEDTLIHLIHSASRFDGATKDSLAPAEDRSHHPGYTSIPEALSAKIEWISSKISCKILNGVEEHRTTRAVLDMLKMYKWEMKIVLALAAFTLTYAEFCLLAHAQDSDQLAKKLAILKQFPSIMENGSSLKPRFDTLNDLVKITLEVTKCVIEVQDPPTEHATANDYIPIVCYWTIRSIVACTTQITSLANGYAIFSSTDTWELSKLTLKLENIISYLRQLADSGSINITTPRFNLSAGSASVTHDEAYERLRDIFSNPQTDNVKVLEALINAQDAVEPLYYGRLERTVELEELPWKTVLLLISGLEFSASEIEYLSYLLLLREGKQVMYDLVWIPIVDPDSEWTEAEETRFRKVQGKMPWYSVRDPSLIGKPIISFIEKEWKYRNKPIIVVLDKQGNVSCLNAIHMISIWGSDAFPFTISAEDVLWKRQSWDLGFLLENPYSSFYHLRKKKLFRAEYTFLYGGNDLEWIRRFVDEARKVQTATKINLDMIYVGKSNEVEQMEEIIKTLDLDNLNPLYSENRTFIWVFWLRLQSMLFSKLQVKQIGDNNPQMQDIEKLLGKEDDNVMDDIKKLLSYDKCGGWILLANSSSEIVMIGNAETGLQTLVDDMWREHVSMVGFANAFKNHYNKVRSVVSSCCTFEFSPKIEKTSELLVCPECHKNMHVMTTFQCCHNEETYEDFFF